MSETATTTTEPTVAEMRAYLRAERPDLNVGLRGFLSQDAKDAFAAARAEGKV